MARLLDEYGSPSRVRTRDIIARKITIHVMCACTFKLHTYACTKFIIIPPFDIRNDHQQQLLRVVTLIPTIIFIKIYNDDIRHVRASSPHTYIELELHGLQ